MDTLKCIHNRPTVNGSEWYIKDCLMTEEVTTGKDIAFCLDSMPITPVCKEGQFRCKQGACVSQNNLCDGRPNCEDGEDEHLSFCYLSCVALNGTDGLKISQGLDIMYLRLLNLAQITIHN